MVWEGAGVEEFYVLVAYLDQENQPQGIKDKILLDPDIILSKLFKGCTGV